MELLASIVFRVSVQVCQQFRAGTVLQADGATILHYVVIN